MKRYSALGIILLAGAALPDELVLRSGLHLSGIYYGGSAQAVRFATTAEPDRIQTFSEQNVKAVFFGEEQPAKAVESVPRPSSYQPALPVPVAQRSILRAGVNCTVLLIDPIDSKHEGQGRSYRASIDVPVYAGGATVIPHGADVLLTLVEDQNSGHFGGEDSANCCHE